jgi:hypothetical protein
MYQPESAEGKCAWCGEKITYKPTGREPYTREISPGVIETSPSDWDFPWKSLDSSRVCFEEDPHVPTFDVIITRDGASSRTADELMAVFIMDVDDLRGEGLRTPAMGQDMELAAKVEGWLDDPDDSQALHDAVMDWEGYLSEAGYSVAWDDGYVIWRVAE